MDKEDYKFFIILAIGLGVIVGIVIGKLLLS